MQDHAETPGRFGMVLLCAFPAPHVTLARTLVDSRVSGTLVSRTADFWLQTATTATMTTAT